MELKEGRKYKDRNGDTWMCIRVNLQKEAYCQADCINLSYLASAAVEYFFLDGRYDYGGTNPRTLVEELPPPVLGPSLTELRDEALRIATSHGFTDASVGEDIALMHSELSEALEDCRAGRSPTWYEYQMLGCDPSAFKTFEAFEAEEGERKLGPYRKPVGIPSEMADVIIRVLHFCGKHGIDIGRAVREKMLHNDSRPFKHGGKTL